jgi:hypothetical protein
MKVQLASNSAMLKSAIDKARSVKDRSPEEIAQRDLTTKELRAVTSAFFVAKGIAPAQISGALREPSEGLKGLLKLRELGVQLGVPSTIALDLDVADDLIKAEIKRAVAGTSGAIVTDGATLKNEKVTAILYEAPALPVPVLLSLVAPDDDGVYDAVKCAQDIRAVCDEYGIGLTSGQVVALAGDNVTFNAALSAALGIPHAKCLPHAIALTVKHGASQLTGMADLTVKAGGMITAGGTSKRVQELKDMGLDPEKMRTYPNRFGNDVNNANYRARNFTLVKQFHVSGATLPDKDADVVDDEELHDGLASLAGQAAASRQAYSAAHAHVMLWAYAIMYEDADSLIKATSGQASSVPADIGDRLRFQRALYSRYSGKDGATGLINQAISQVESQTGKPYTQAQKDAFVTKLVPLFQAAGKKALESWDKHIDPALKLLSRRFQYDPRIPPTIAGDPPKEWFGALPEKYGPKLLTEWAHYMAERASEEERRRVEYETKCTAAGEDVEPLFDLWSGFNVFKYWEGKRVIWPSLSAIALWWSAVPTSAIAAERSFAILRNIALPLRCAMTLASVQRELRMRVNCEIVAKLVRQRLAKL